MEVFKQKLKYRFCFVFGLSDTIILILALRSFHFLLANLIHSLRISTLAIFITIK